MARHSRLEVLRAMKDIGIIPVFSNSDYEVARNIADACMAGGARCIEFTNRGDRVIDVFRRLAEYRDSDCPEMIMGVGTICDAPTAAMYISAGADFVVSPFLDEPTARLCNKRKIPYSPGCATVTEIHNAYELGVEICKIFPAAEVGGPSFVKAVKGPCPWVDIMPTGGVLPDKDSLAEWFDAGIACAGMGSKLIRKDLVEKGDWQAIARKVREAVDAVSQLRSR